MAEERWVEIPGTLYSVSDRGRVASVWFGKWHVLRPGKHPCGYRQVILCGEGKQTPRYVHRLVASAFLPPASSDRRNVNHKDGNKANNTPDNLEWCTNSENELHSHAILGKQPARGSAVGTSRLSAAQVVEIRARLAAGETRRAIAPLYGICHQNVTAIANGKIWQWFVEGN